MVDKLQLIAIKSNKGYYISGRGDYHYSDYLRTKLFDNVHPELTFHNDWVLIPNVPTKISHMERQENINYRFVLTDDSLNSKLKPELTREEAGSFIKDCNDETRFVWKDELAMYRSLYVEISDPQPDKEVIEPFEFKVIFEIDEIKSPAEMKYPINERYVPYSQDNKKVTDYLTNSSVSHQVLDQIIFPTILLPSTPSRLSSKDTYQIIRQHIRYNINPKVAKITSDYDFCFAVAKVIGLAETRATTFTPINQRNRRKPKTETRLISTREVQIFEMTNEHDNYKGYTPIKGFEANSESELKEQIDSYLKDLMEIINKPLIDCPHCKGTGVVENGQV